MSELTYIVAAMHGLAQRHAHKASITHFKTVTQAFSLRGLPREAKIVVVDSELAFTDSRAMAKALERFTNVSHVPA